jgi:hypothetical protein
MCPNNPQEPSVDEMMSYWSKGKSLQEVADRFDKSYRVVEQMVSRYKHAYERNFNFPHIIHAKRFGA